MKLSDNEVGFLFGLSPREGAAYIRERFGTQLVFVTCGADGCEFASLRAQGHVDGFKGLTVTDTTGARATFSGGCAVWRLLQSGKPPAALDEAELRGIAEFACRVAGRSTEKSGGISAITEMPDEVFMVMGAAELADAGVDHLADVPQMRRPAWPPRGAPRRFVGGVDGVRAAVKAVYIDAPALFVLYGADAAAMGTDVQINFINRIHRDPSFSLLMAV